jgi:hypothetical protein
MTAAPSRGLGRVGPRVVPRDQGSTRIVEAWMIAILTTIAARKGTGQRIVVYCGRSWRTQPMRMMCRC